jgi:hypothetical protein
MEALDATVVVGGPAAVLVAADAAFEPVHGGSRPLTVYRSKSTGTNSGNACVTWTVTAEIRLSPKRKRQSHAPNKRGKG